MVSSSILQELALPQSSTLRSLAPPESSVSNQSDAPMALCRMVGKSHRKKYLHNAQYCTMCKFVLQWHGYEYGGGKHEPEHRLT